MLVNRKNSVLLLSPDTSCFIPATPRHSFRPGFTACSLQQPMLQLSKPGVRHELKFDKESGLPANPSYTYVQLRDQGWVTIGGWKKANASIVNPYQLESLGGKRVIEIRDYQPSLSGKILKVVTLMEPPFVMLDPNHDNPDKPCKFSHCFDGYAIELLDKIAQIHRFTYTLYLSPDGEYGRKSKGPNGNEQWTGMVKELLKENAQMAVGAFTVSSDREKVISFTKLYRDLQMSVLNAQMAVGAFTVSSDREKVISFTKPYRDLQMSVLVGQSAKTEYNPFSFLVPFEPRLWIYIILTGLSIGIYLAIVDKLSPYGHHGKKVQNESEDEFEEMDINEDGTIDEWERRNWIREKEAMNFHNAIFWSFASFFEQGGEYHPRAWSGRIVAAAWWFGIVIIIATYTANLAAFLTIKTSKDAINSAQDLAKQDKIRYTYIKGTEVETFFERHSNDPLGKEPYKHMGQKILGWKESEKNPLPVFTRTNDTVEQLKSMNGSLALITDGVLTDYWRGQKCDDVRVLKKRFAHIGYAFGLPIESMFRDELSLEVLKLRENGDIDKLDFKWLVSTSLCKEESKVKEGSAENQQVTLASMLGVFYVVYAGFSIAIVVLVFEWIVSCFQSIDTDHPRRPTSFKQAFQDKLHRLKVDFLENWFPCKLRNTNESEKLFAVRRVPPLAVVNRTVTVDGETGPVSARTRGNAWN